MPAYKMEYRIWPPSRIAFSEQLHATVQFGWRWLKKSLVVPLFMVESCELHTKPTMLSTSSRSILACRDSKRGQGVL